jgi:hypothetical protein
MRFIDLLPQLLGEVPGCPDITAINALRNATIEFCTEAPGAWAELQEDSQVLASEVHTYEVEAPAGARVLKVLEAWVNGEPLIPKTQADISRLMPNWQLDRGNLPQYFNSVGGRTQVRVFPTPLNPPANAALLFRVAYAPSINSPRLDDSLANEHFEALMSGAKARLMAMANKAWTSAQLAVYHGEKFQNAIVDKRIELMHGGVHSSMTVAPVAFG